MTTADAMRQRLEAAWARSDALFGLLRDHALLERPIPLRHPFLFYVGHLPAFARNHVHRGVLDQPGFRPEFDDLFERGIDPLSDRAAAAATIRAWPPVREVHPYRDRVRDGLRESFDAVAARADDDVLAQGFRIYHVVHEHERMHHETLLYMLLELEHARKQPPNGIPAPETGPALEPEVVHVPAGRATLGADFADQPFGWDNEFPAHVVDVDAFAIDSVPVTNARYLAFVEATGRDLPHAWRRDGGDLVVRTMFEDAPFDAAAGWPAQVTHAEATAYARWRGGRLPTEAELHRAAYGTPDGDERPYPWGDAPPEARHGGFDFHTWAPLPVGSRPDGASAWGVHELVGNGWEWTSTPFRPLPGFEPWIRTYPGYSADFFDDAHFVVFGAAWPTDAALLRRSFRNWYQGEYPYPFTAFRLAYDT